MNVRYQTVAENEIKIHKKLYGIMNMQYQRFRNKNYYSKEILWALTVFKRVLC